VANIEALKSAARAAIVMPSVFAFADQVIGNPQTSLFAAFGSFAILVLVEFGGRRRMRLVAYLAFAASGSCSSHSGRSAPATRGSPQARPESSAS
jgi:hypothetical protein